MPHGARLGVMHNPYAILTGGLREIVCGWAECLFGAIGLRSPDPEPKAEDRWMPLGDRPDEEAIAQDLWRRMDKWAESDLVEFGLTPRDQLAKFHFTLGMAIRNHYRLWSYKPHVPQIDDRGADVAKDPPDKVSMRIMERVWDLFHGK